MKTFKDLVDMLHESGAEITFSQWCISGLVPDCKCSRCLTSRGLPVTPETERAAEERSGIESKAFRQKALASFLKADHHCPRCADFTEFQRELVRQAAKDLGWRLIGVDPRMPGSERRVVQVVEVKGK